MGIVGDIGGVKAAICTALRGVSSLKRVYDHLPENINETPCAYCIPKSGRYHIDCGSNMTHQMEVTVLLKRIGDIEEAQEALDDYLNATGTIMAAIEGATLGTYAHALRVDGYRDYGAYEYPPGTQNYFVGVKYDILVLA